MYPNISAERCPGVYCGRMILENNTFSECGACPRSFRVNSLYICESCTNIPSTYDCLYLGFMCVLPLILHWFCIDLSAVERSFSKQQLILHFSAFCEVLISSVAIILLTEPLGEFKLNSCKIERLSDWYTLFHNPTPMYREKLHCTQEAVYPFQTIVLEYYFLCIIMMILLRPWLNKKFLKEGKSAVYTALYFLPILAVLHSVAGGLIYYVFPYLSIVISMISNAAHFSLKLNQSMKSLIKTSVTELKNLVIIFGHWLLLAYGIVSLNQHLIYLALVPLPAIFYILTVKCTDPSEFRDKEGEDRNN